MLGEAYQAMALNMNLKRGAGQHLPLPSSRGPCLPVEWQPFFRLAWGGSDQLWDAPHFGGKSLRSCFLETWKCRRCGKSHKNIGQIQRAPIPANVLHVCTRVHSSGSPETCRRARESTERGRDTLSGNVFSFQVTTLPSGFNLKCWVATEAWFAERGLLVVSRPAPAAQTGHERWEEVRWEALDGHSGCRHGLIANGNPGPVHAEMH